MQTFTPVSEPQRDVRETTSGPARQDAEWGHLPLVVTGQGIYLQGYDVTPMRSPYRMLVDAKDWGLWQLARFVCWALEHD